MLDEQSDDDNTEQLILKCVYCNKCRNPTGFWEQAGILDMVLKKKQTSHVICPKCYKKYFPEEFSSLYREGIITIQKTMTSANEVTYEIFYNADDNSRKDLMGRYLHRLRD